VDSRPLEAGLTVPEEIERREDRKAALEENNLIMERRYEKAKRERGEEAARENESGDSAKKRGGGGRKRGDGAAAENGGGEENIQKAERDGGTGIRDNKGFRQFLLRGLEKVNQEWEIVCLVYNLKRLYRLSRG
jgi:hypothetical protein